MIAFIKGIVAEITENGIVLEAGVMGYEIYMSAASVDKNLYQGKEVLVYTYLHVREDAMQLYGFLTKDDLKVFKLLLGVSGIGPKGALGVLSGISPDELRFAVLSDDVKTISKAPGIGRKTAQKLILELKDKLSLEDAFEQKLANVQQEASVGGLKETVRQEAVEALVALGYSGTDALRAVRAVAPEQAQDVETLLKAALKNM